MSCDIFHLEDPATGQVVSVITESDGSLSFLNADGTVYAGDATALRPCPSGVTPIVNEGPFGNGVDYTDEILLHEDNITDGTQYAIDHPNCDIAEAGLVYKRDDGKLVAPDYKCTRIDCELSVADTSTCPDPAVTTPLNITSIAQGGFGDSAIGLTGYLGDPNAPIVPLGQGWRDFTYTPTNAENCIIMVSASYQSYSLSDMTITTTSGQTSAWTLHSSDGYRTFNNTNFSAVHDVWWACVEGTDPITVEMEWANSVLAPPLVNPLASRTSVAAWTADEICGICDKTQPFKQDAFNTGIVTNGTEDAVQALPVMLAAEPTCPTYIAHAGWHITSTCPDGLQTETWCQDQTFDSGVQLGNLDPDVIDLSVNIQGDGDQCQTGVISAWSGLPGCCPGYPAAGKQAYDVYHSVNVANIGILSDLSTARVFEINCCEYECPPPSCNPPKAIFSDGEIESIVACAATGPVGGDETYDVLVDGVVVDSVTIADGADSGTSTAAPIAVAAGSKFSIQLQSSTATTAAECVTVSAIIKECV